MQATSFPTLTTFPVYDASSPFVAMLPYVDQSPLFDAFNAALDALCSVENSTVTGTGLAVLVCPSDSLTTSDSVTVTTPQMTFRFTSYAGSWGYYPTNFAGLYFQPVLSQVNGVLPPNGWARNPFAPTRPPVRLAEVTDGTSNTIAFGEHAHGLFSKSDFGGGGTFYYLHKWAVSEALHTQGSFLSEVYPINAFKKYKPFVGAQIDQAGAIGAGASSFHPGGANFTFCDGSVRFLKESIDSWTLDTQSGIPIGLNFAIATGWTIAPGSRIGVYQGLASKAGGEVISADSY
jgi:prepilin-type processing-associated H-X9-DG protein